MPNPDFIYQTQKNLLYTIRAAEGSTLFKHNFVLEKSTSSNIDTLEDGKLSCAYVVSCLLAIHRLIDRPHATVTTTLEKMEHAGWRKSDTPVPGAVVYWPVVEEHGHIGFYLDDDTYMSNSTAKGVPALHGRVMADGREPTAFYVHDALL
jgi:hypothetical protein